MMVQPSLTLHSQELFLCGPTRVHLRGRLRERERDGERGGRKWVARQKRRGGVKMTA